MEWYHKRGKNESFEDWMLYEFPNLKDNEMFRKVLKKHSIKEIKEKREKKLNRVLKWKKDSKNVTK